MGYNKFVTSFLNATVIHSMVFIPLTHCNYSLYSIFKSWIIQAKNKTNLIHIYPYTYYYPWAQFFNHFFAVNNVFIHYTRDIITSLYFILLNFIITTIQRAGHLFSRCGRPFFLSAHCAIKKINRGLKYYIHRRYAVSMPGANRQVNVFTKNLICR